MKGVNGYYLYALLDPFKEGIFNSGGCRVYYEPFYIGRGKGYRCKYHLTPSARKVKSIKNNIINRIFKNGKKPIIHIIKDGLTSDEADVLEIKLIKEYGRKFNSTGSLSNIADGGNSVTGFTLRQESKIKISESLKAYYKSIGGMPEYRKEQIREFNKKLVKEGKHQFSGKRDSEWKAKLSNSLKLAYKEGRATTNHLYMKTQEGKDKLAEWNKTAKLGNENNAKKYIINGEAVSNLSKFCRDHNINYSSIVKKFSYSGKDKIVYKGIEIVRLTK